MYEVSHRYTYSESQDFTSIDDVVDYIINDEDYISEYDVDIDEELNEAYGSIDIYGNNFSAAAILYNMSEDEYYAFADERRRESAAESKGDIYERIEQLDPGDSGHFSGGITVTYIADESDDTPAEGFNEVFAM